MKYSQIEANKKYAVEQALQSRLQAWIKETEEPEPVVLVLEPEEQVSGETKYKKELMSLLRSLKDEKISFMDTIRLRKIQINACKRLIRKNRAVSRGIYADWDETKFQRVKDSDRALRIELDKLRDKNDDLKTLIDRYKLIIADAEIELEKRIDRIEDIKARF